MGIKLKSTVFLILVALVAMLQPVQNIPFPEKPEKNLPLSSVSFPLEQFSKEESFKELYKYERQPDPILSQNSLAITVDLGQDEKNRDRVRGHDDLTQHHESRLIIALPFILLIIEAAITMTLIVALAIVIAAKVLSFVYTNFKQIFTFIRTMVDLSLVSLSRNRTTNTMCTCNDHV